MAAFLDIDGLANDAQGIKPKSTTVDLNKMNHFFISYRQGTDIEMSQSMFTGVKALVLDNTFGMKGKKPMIFLDIESLTDGEPWDEGFVKGMVKSTICVPVMTWYENDTGSVGQMLQLEHNDHCDNVLLEWELALALINYPKSNMKSIFPVIFGGHDNRGYLDFPFSNAARLPATPSFETKKRLVEICKSKGVVFFSIVCDL